MVFKKILTIITGTIISFSANAEMRSEAFLGYNGLSFDRNTNDFISSEETADLESYNLGGYIVKDINETTALSILGKYVEYNTGDFYGYEDDSPKDTLSFLCNSAALPGVQILSNDYRRQGYGPFDRRAFGVQVTDIPLTFFVH